MNITDILSDQMITYGFMDLTHEISRMLASREGTRQGLLQVLEMAVTAKKVPDISNLVHDIDASQGCVDALEELRRDNPNFLHLYARAVNLTLQGGPSGAKSAAYVEGYESTVRWVLISAHATWTTAWAIAEEEPHEAV